MMQKFTTTLCMLLWLGFVPCSPADIADDGPFVAGRFALEIEGQFAGYVQRVSGGNIVGEVAAHQLGRRLIVKKHLATISHEPIMLEIDMSMTKPIYDWIQASVEQHGASRSGAIVTVGADSTAIFRREFFDALITEVTFPALDAFSSEPVFVFMRIRIQPEEIRYVPGSGNGVPPPEEAPAKRWLPSNFRFELGDLPTARIARIDGFTWKMRAVRDEVGSFRQPTKEPTKLELPDLGVSIATQDAQPWYDWFEDFVIRGNNGDKAERHGSLTFLAPDMSTELGEVTFENVGIFKLDPDDREANSDEVATFSVQLYVEEMKFQYNE